MPDYSDPRSSGYMSNGKLHGGHLPVHKIGQTYPGAPKAQRNFGQMLDILRIEIDELSVLVSLWLDWAFFSEVIIAYYTRLPGRWEKPP